MPAYQSITPENLSRLIGSPESPRLVDVRSDEEFSADPRFIAGAIRRPPGFITEWAADFVGKAAVVISRDGAAAGQGSAAWLGLENDALRRLASVVLGADTGRPHLTAESAGLLAFSLGLSRLRRSGAARGGNCAL